MKRETGFDVGTSPHGLSADLPPVVRKHATGSASAPSGKLVLVLPGVDLPEATAAQGASRRKPAAPAAGAKPKPKRGNQFVRQVREDRAAKLPDCATTDSPIGTLNPSHFVPVSFVAKDWNVTPRRIRSLLAAKRLEGRREANGYWEVAYPYRFIIGTRGPVLKRQQKPKRGRPKSAGSAE